MLRYRRTIAGDPQAFSIDIDAAALAALDRPRRVRAAARRRALLRRARRPRPGPRDAVPVRVAGPARAGADRVPPAQGSRRPRRRRCSSTATSRRPEVAMHEFLRLVCGDDGVDRARRGGAQQAVAATEAAAGQFFEAELPAVAAWDVDTSLLDRIDVPVLDVVGAASSPALRRGFRGPPALAAAGPAPRRRRRRSSPDGSGPAQRRRPARCVLAGCRLRCFLMGSSAGLHVSRRW